MEVGKTIPGGGPGKTAKLIVWETEARVAQSPGSSSVLFWGGGTRRGGELASRLEL